MLLESGLGGLNIVPGFRIYESGKEVIRIGAGYIRRHVLMKSGLIELKVGLWIDESRKKVVISRIYYAIVK